MSLKSLRTFFGWCTVINLAFFMFNVLVILTAKDWVSGFHAELFGLEKEAVRMAYFEYLAIYKIAWIVFCFVPYWALWLMTGQKEKQESGSIAT